jgi:transcription elongation factor Elf1
MAKPKEQQPTKSDSVFVCLDCGRKHLTPQQRKDDGSVCTMHVNECGICHIRKPVTHIRHFNWLYMPKLQPPKKKKKKT